ncbi:uncharacterized protein LOC111262408 [Varroa jacobsoni]|uniref:Uncharacterized protein n=1 Tax=Varroa destructor TaxID=109461 RepID=A0A7M7L0X4_VARDE|nr:uncharacterized protein LOC111253403 [Varroa destructor]XP_022692383.1 uncharacterized protein LOC111262408 [Varroa jacobsoni]
MYRNGGMHGAFQSMPKGSVLYGQSIADPGSYGTASPFDHILHLLSELLRSIQFHPAANGAAISGPEPTHYTRTEPAGTNSGISGSPTVCNSGFINSVVGQPTVFEARSSYAPGSCAREDGVWHAYTSGTPQGGMVLDFDSHRYFDEVDAHRISATADPYIVGGGLGAGPLFNLEELSPYRSHAGQHHYDANDNYAGICSLGSFNTGPYNEAEAEALYQSVQNQSLVGAPRAAGLGFDKGRLSDTFCGSSICPRSACPRETFNAGPYYVSRETLVVSPCTAGDHLYGPCRILPPDIARYEAQRNILSRPVVGGANYNTCCTCICICRTDFNPIRW